jgi:8-oxo-dGTP pyrophosphatase MutT (NUDIX family)
VSSSPAPLERRAALPPAAKLGAALADHLEARRPVALHERARRAGVLIMLYDRAGAPHTVLTKRTDTLLHHAGQVSLPGGGWEPADLGMRATALRETEEELGVPPSALTVVGRLDDVPTMVSGFIVTPFVAVLEGSLRPRPCDAEIARVLEVALADLLDADARLPDRPDRLTLRYPLLDEDVWGATARILHAFCAVVRSALGPA